MLPSTTLNTHMLYFSDSEGRDPIPITENKAKAILTFLSDPNKPSHFHLLDANGNFKEAIPRRIVKSVKEIEKRILNSGDRWICDNCGRKNPMHVWPSNRCECKQDRAEWLQRMTRLQEEKNLAK